MQSDLQAFFTALGAFVSACSSFETVVDVGLRNELGIDNLKAEILISSLAYKAKSTALCSLLSSRAREHDAIKIVQKYDSDSKRNKIIHSQSFFDANSKSMSFLSGRTAHKYKASRETFSVSQLTGLAHSIGALALELQKALSISDADLQAFTAVRFGHAVV